MIVQPLVVDFKASVDCRDNVPPRKLSVVVQSKLRIARKGRLEDPIKLLEVVPLVLAYDFPSAPALF